MPANKSVQRSLALIKDDPSKVLGLTVGEHKVTPGLYVPKAEAQNPPELSFDVPSASGTYLVIGLDVDAPFPSFDVLGPILHWIQPGLKQTGGSSTLTSTDPFVADYIGPAPPPISTPHRYMFFLYDQPADFDGKKYAPPDGKSLGLWSRMRCSLDDWEKKVGLSPAIAANYFTSN